MRREYLQRKRAVEKAGFGNSLLHFPASLKRLTFPRSGPQWTLVWRDVYFRTFLSSAQPMRSSLLNQGVKQFDHCIYAIPNREGVQDCRA